MRAILRWGAAFLAAGLMLGGGNALAQEADATTNAPAAESIGPRELQGFSLQGTVTRTAEQPPASAEPAPRAAAPRAEAPSRNAPPQPVRSAERSPATAPTVGIPSPAAQPTPRAIADASPGQSPRRSSITVDLPPIGSNVTPAAAVAASADFAANDDTGTLAPQTGLSLWPWLLAAMVLGAGGAYLLRRRQHEREALAGGPRIDAFVAPQPAARAPRAAPAPPAAPVPAPAPAGIVSTRLRPWIDFTFKPLRCVVEAEEVRFEFELAMVNSGSAPARDVLIEASTFNAGPAQDREIQQFFDSPVAEGDRIATIPPLQNFTVRTQLSVARDQVRVLEAGGRHVFVPLIAFNAVYRWGTGTGQTSAAFLLGRDTKGEKMAPFRLDLGPRVFRGIGQRALPLTLRR